MRLFVYCLAMVALAQEPEAVDVKGTVVNSATGQPIAGASVVLTQGFVTPPIDLHAGAGPQPISRIQRRKPDEFNAVTDEGGQFTFHAVLGMGWFLNVSHRGYRSPENGSDIARVQGPPGKPDGPLTVKLDPLGVIEGKVSNEDGEPMPGITVELLKVSFQDGVRNVRRYATKNTDDLGAYRLWNLSPGSYYLKVAGRRGTSVSTTATPQMTQSDEAYGPVYFPSSPDLAGARLIRLTPAETMNADFAVSGQWAFRIHGKFLNSIASRRIVVRLLRGDDEMANRTGINSGNGTFEVFDVTPGAYTLQAYTSDAGEIVFGEVQVSIGNGDLSGVTVVLAGAATVSGTVEPAGERAQVVLTNSNPQKLPPGVSASSTAISDQEGRFTVANLWPGQYGVAIRTFGMKYVTSAECGSIDVLSDGIPVGGGPVEPIKVRLAEGGGSIRATLAEQEAGVDSFELGIVSKSRPGSLIVRTMASAVPRPQSTQGFVLHSGMQMPMDLAPGEYLLLAWRHGQNIAYRNPAVLAALSSYATSVTVATGESKEVELRLIPKGEY